MGVENADLDRFFESRFGDSSGPTGETGRTGPDGPPSGPTGVTGMTGPAPICGMGYPSLGLPCIRPAGHASPLSVCFAVTVQNNELWGVWMYQDGKEWVADSKHWPDDLLLQKAPPGAEPPEPKVDRRAAVAATKAKKAGL